MTTSNLAKQYKLAGIKGMSESNGTMPAKTKVEYQSQYNILPRLINESIAEWKVRCKK